MIKSEKLIQSFMFIVFSSFVFVFLFQGVYKNNANLFTVKNQAEFIDGSTDGVRDISSYSQEEFNKLNSFYQENVHKTTSYNSDGSLRNANKAFAKENEAIIDYISKHPGSTINDAIRNFIPNTVEAIANTPNTIKGAGNYIDAVLPTTNQDRLDTLYGSHTDGSVLQANLHTADVISTAGMAVGGSSLVKGGAKAVNNALERSVDDALDIELKGVTGKGEVGEIISRSENIPHIGSKHPNPEIQKNIEETIGYIFDDSKKPPKKIRDKWGEAFNNDEAYLPSQTADGKPIEYKEYKVRPIEGGRENNVHRIVVGSDGKYYYTNTHYGAPDYDGIPFYEAGKLPKETIEKIFKKDSK